MLLVMSIEDEEIDKALLNNNKASFLDEVEDEETGELTEFNINPNSGD
jgi:hypothetical protein